MSTFDVCENVDIRDTVDDAYRNGYDGTLIASDNNIQVGYLSYSVYKGKPAIKMIWVSPDHRRKQIAMHMLRELQKMFPKEEIDWGYTTDDGSALKRSISFRKERNDAVTKLKTKLTAIRSKLAKMNYKLEMLQQSDPVKARAYSQTVGDRWNQLNDLEYKLEQQLDYMGPEYIKFINECQSMNKS